MTAYVALVSTAENPAQARKMRNGANTRGVYPGEAVTVSHRGRDYVGVLASTERVARHIALHYGIGRYALVDDQRQTLEIRSV